MKCNHCEKEIQEGSKFCPYCGQKVEQVIKCPNCGKSIRPGDLYCMGCGWKVGSTETEVQKQDGVSEIHQTAHKEDANSSSPRKTEGRSKTPLFVGIIACAAILLAGLFYFLRSSDTNANNPQIEIGKIWYKGSYVIKNWSYGRGWKNYDILSLDIAWPVSINGVEPTQLQEKILQKIWDWDINVVNVKDYESSDINHILMNMYEKKLNYIPEVPDDPEAKKIWIREIEAKVSVLASTKKYITFEYNISLSEYEYSGDGIHGYVTYDIAKSECVEDRLINKNSVSELIKYLLRDNEYYNPPFDDDLISALISKLEIGLSERGIICDMDDGYDPSVYEECSLQQLRNYVSDECVELLTDNKHCDYVRKDIGNIITF